MKSSIQTDKIRKKDALALGLAGTSAAMFIAASAAQTIWLPIVGLGLALSAAALKLFKKSAPASTPFPNEKRIEPEVNIVIPVTQSEPKAQSHKAAGTQLRRTG